jgi:ammonia channel protein AmtB
MESSSLFETSIGLDKSWLLVCSAMIMSMQIGFAWLEAGGIRKKNASVVYYKLTLNLMITVLSFWAVGYGFGFGDAEDRFVGAKRFYAGNQWEDYWEGHQTQYAHWLFQTCIAAVVPAITGGVIAERATLKATAIHTLILTLFIYPFVLSWTWGGGFMKTVFYYRDFTGSGIVHCTGAFAGLAGLIVIGPRYMRYGDHKNVLDESKKRIAPEHATEMESPNKNLIPLNAMEKQPLKVKHIVPEVQEDTQAFTLENIKKMRAKVIEDGYDEIGISDLGVLMTGALFLWLGFIFFNAGSSLFVHSKDTWLAAEKAAVNTFMAGAGGGFLALAFKKNLIHGFSAPRTLKDDAATVANAFLGGMVANGAGMDTYEPWEALVVGMLGAFVYCLLCYLFEKKKLDDALEAFQLHGGCGTTGVWAAAFFNHETGIFHGGPGETLGRHILCWLIIAAWSFIWSFIVYAILNKYGMFRLDLKTEIIGYDFIDFAQDLKFSGKKLERVHAKHTDDKDKIELAYQEAPKTEKADA